jgi:hypothetical protein
MIRTPTEATLRKYGLDVMLWASLWQAQGQICPVCGREPPSGRTVIDHEHVKGWKKMAGTDRKAFVRGICCWTCNRFFLARGMDTDKAANLYSYLVRYEERTRCS